MDRWTPNDDRGHDRPGHDQRGYGRSSALAARPARPLLKWMGLFLAWAFVTWLLEFIHLDWLIWPVMVALIGYVVVDILRVTPPTKRGRR